MSEQTFNDGRYYAKGDVVWKSSVKTRNDDNTTSYTLGFPVCTVSPYVDAETVAEVLNQGDDQARAAVAADASALGVGGRR